MKNMKRHLALLLLLAVIGSSVGVSAASLQNNRLTPMVEASQGEGVGIRAQVSPPDEYNASFVNTSGTIQVAVGAKVVLPQVDQAPVMRIEPAKFTQAQADTLIAHLVKGELFEAESYVPSKAMLQAKNDRLESLLAAEDDSQPKSYGEPAAVTAGYSSQIMLQAQIDVLKAEMDAAAESPVTQPCDGKLTTYSREYRYAEDGSTIMENGERIDALTYSEAGGYEIFSMYTSNKEMNHVWYAVEPAGIPQHMGNYGPISEDMDISQAAPLALGEADAKAKAQALLDALGLMEMECVVAEKSLRYTRDPLLGDQTSLPLVWVLRYSRTVAGIPTTYSDFDCIKVESDDQAAPHPYEMITFAIDDSGIVGFAWNSPYAITETLTDDAALIGFDDLIAVFEAMVFPVNEWMAENGAVEINVREIRLGMSRVTERDVRDRGLLIPVWDFFGDAVMHYTSNGQEQTMKLENWNLLTVNAIDGTVIDRNLGY